MPPLLAELQTRQTRREAVLATITRAEAVVDVTRISRSALERKAHALVAAWHARLAGATDRTRQTLREVFNAPVVVDADGHFEGELLLGSFAGECGIVQPLWCARQVSNLRPPV